MSIFLYRLLCQRSIFDKAKQANCKKIDPSSCQNDRIGFCWKLFAANSVSLCIFYAKSFVEGVFIGPESDHCIGYACHSLTHSLTN